MEISITQPAINQLINEMDLKNGDQIRFFVRYGGKGNIAGFSLGINTDKPFEPVAKTEVSGITFFVENKDAWYFEGHDLQIKYSRKREEIEFVVE